MTGARAAAIEAACEAYWNADKSGGSVDWAALIQMEAEHPECIGARMAGRIRTSMEIALASMSAAGWVMVRDVGEMAIVDADTLERMDGWNACRAAMLADQPPMKETR